MKIFQRIGLFALFLMLGSVVVAQAEDAATPNTVVSTETKETAPSAAPVVVAAPVVPATPEPTPLVPPAVPVEAPATAAATDNLEFVSGEISALDVATKSVSVRLYGETEGATDEKTLTVNLDENTDITDGEQDRDLKSLSVGTEVDVEYDPTTNKATYIFVY